MDDILEQIKFNRTHLIRLLLRERLYDVADICNLPTDPSEGQEVVQWLEVTDGLGAKLIAHGAIVLKNEHGSYWGRDNDLPAEGDAVILNILHEVQIND